MAWTDLSAAFGYGTKLTSTQQGQLRDNATYNYDFLASGNLTDHGILLGSGANPITPTAVMTDGQLLVGQSAADPLPKTMSGHGTLSALGVLAITVPNNAITQAKMADNAIGQAELKDSSGSVNVVGTPQANILLPGGIYGFFPQIKSNSELTSQEPLASMAGADGTAASTSYITTIFLGNEGAGATGYAQQYYMTASGEVHWVFILRDKITKKIRSMYQSPDHPCFGNGGKPLLVPHPFGGYDESKYEIIAINPSLEEVERMELATTIDDETKPDRDLLEIIAEDYEIDELSTPAWPTEEVTVGLPKKIEVEVGGKKVMKPVNWKFIPAGTKVIPIKKVIPKPSYVICKSLKKK